MGIKPGDFDPTAALFDREGFLYDAQKKGQMGVGAQMVAQQRDQKVQARAAEAEAEKKRALARKQAGQAWAQQMTTGFKAGGSVKGWGKARSGKACKVY
jgi:hypothetical protein